MHVLQSIPESVDLPARVGRLVMCSLVDENLQRIVVRRVSEDFVRLEHLVE